jgi:type III pantothenate kinase
LSIGLTDTKLSALDTAAFYKKIAPLFFLRTMPLIAVDIGNSRTKFGIFDGQEAVFPAAFDDLADILRSKKGPVHWAVARTGSEAEQHKIETFIQRHRPQDTFKKLTNDDVPLKCNADKPERVGIDRLLAALAAVKHVNGGLYRCILIVDAGSAATIDSVSAGILEGGAILPGLRTAAKSLLTVSPKLPLVETFDNAVYPGKNTATAIRTGLVLQIAGAVCQCYESVSSKRSGSIPLFLTGGDADALYRAVAEALPETEIIVEPNLVLLGIADSCTTATL